MTTHTYQQSPPPAATTPTRTRRPAARTTARAQGLILMLLVALVLVGYWQYGSGPATADNPVLPLGGTVQTLAVIALAIIIQALPFLVLGVIISASIATYAPVTLLTRLTPRSRFLTVPAATTAAIALPGCECSSVPVARALMIKGLSPAAALSFMLAAPSLNPVVIVSTAVAFYDHPAMAWARFIASFIAVVTAGWLWLSLGNNTSLLTRLGINTPTPPAETTPACDCHPTTTTNRRLAFIHAALTDLTQAGIFLILGALVAAAVKVFIPVSWFIELGRQPLLAILLLAALAILLSLCSEADAFVAASFTTVSPTAQLAFLVIGPVIDIKLISMQTGTFGPTFARRYLPLVAICALGSAIIVGGIIFGTL